MQLTLLVSLLPFETTLSWVPFKVSKSSVMNWNSNVPERKGTKLATENLLINVFLIRLSVAKYFTFIKGNLKSRCLNIERINFILTALFRALGVSQKKL
jgi:hypothetical protein